VWWLQKNLGSGWTLRARGMSHFLGRPRSLGVLSGSKPAPAVCVVGHSHPFSVLVSRDIGTHPVLLGPEAGVDP
jgi:hypothetical protein